MNQRKPTYKELQSENSNLRKQIRETNKENKRPGSSTNEAQHIARDDQFRQFVEAINTPIFQLDASGVFLFINKAAAQQLGGQPEDFMNKSLFDAFPGDVAEVHLAGLCEIIRTGQGRIRESQTVLKGHNRWYRTQAQPLHDAAGNISSVIFIGSDISGQKIAEQNLKVSINELEKEIARRKKTESSLRKSLDRLNEAEKIGAIGSWYHDVKTGQEWWSDNEYMIHDLPLNTNPDYEKHLGCIHPEDRKIHDGAFKEAIASSNDQFSSEYRIVRQDGDVRFLLARYRIERNKNGKATSAYGTDQDITERKNTEAERTEHGQQLEKLVHERTKELELKNKELERFNKLFVGREFRIKELRDKVKELQKMIEENNK